MHPKPMPTETASSLCSPHHCCIGVFLVWSYGKMLQGTAAAKYVGSSKCSFYAGQTECPPYTLSSSIELPSNADMQVSHVHMHPALGRKPPPTLHTTYSGLSSLSSCLNM